MTLTGAPTDHLVAFLAGILVSFTPCVYPLIPVAAAIISGVVAQISATVGPGYATTKTGAAP